MGSNKDLAEATETEKAQAKRRDNTAEELEAMRVAFNAIDKLSEGGKNRVMKWLDGALSAYSGHGEPPF